MATESSKSNLHHFKAHVLSDIGKQWGVNLKKSLKSDHVYQLQVKN